MFVLRQYNLSRAPYLSLSAIQIYYAQNNASVYYIYNTAQHIIIRVPLHYWNKKEKNDFLAENDDFEIKISLHLLLGAIVHQLELLESWLFSKQSESEASFDWVNVPDIAFGFKGHENHEYLSKKEEIFDRWKNINRAFRSRRNSYYTCYFIQTEINAYLEKNNPKRLIKPSKNKIIPKDEMWEDILRLVPYGKEIEKQSWIKEQAEKLRKDNAYVDGQGRSITESQMEDVVEKIWRALNLQEAVRKKQ